MDFVSLAGDLWDLLFNELLIFIEFLILIAFSFKAGPILATKVKNFTQLHMKG